jgi:4-hydroxy-3-methylbut-2-enyl diphosphate reductase
MRVLLAKHSGFCFGVSRAIELVNRAAESDSRVYTFGRIIHNEGVVKELEARGIFAVESVDALQPGDTLVIRAHGAPPEVFRACEEKGVRAIDATCPFVKRIHRIVERAAAAGERVAIFGKPTHPEVVGIRSRAGKDAVVLTCAEDAETLAHAGALTFVSQTTAKAEDYDAALSVLRARFADLHAFCTICDTTRQRQTEAEMLAKHCTRIFVLGSEISANTCALRDLCKKACKKVEIIDNIGKIPLAKIKHDDIIGIIAGASTPTAMIREVKQVMSELEKTTVETIEAEAPAEVVAETTEQVVAEAEQAVAETAAEAVEAVEEVKETAEEAPAVVEEAAEAVAEEAAEAAEEAAAPVAVEAEAEAEPETFEQAFEKTVKRIRPGQMITGTVIQIVDGEVFVNIGYKADGVIPKGEFSADPEVRAEDVVKEGDSIDVEVLMVNDGEGNVRLSRKNVEGRKLMDEMFAEDVEGKTFEAVVKEVVKGGLIADINGVRAFIPASHVSTKYVENLNDYVGKTVKVKVLEADKAKKRIVASIKQVLIEEAKAAKAAKWDALVVGEKVHGVVRRITDFGAFVDIGGLDGLVHVTDCAWGRVKHPSDALSIGQEIEVLILRVDREKEQIGLGYKQLQPKPWTKAAEKYPIGSIVEGKVVRIVPFGAFVALEPTIDGLIHISQVGIHRIEKVEDEIKVGDIVRCKVLDVNVEAKRISLSRKDALIEENPEIAEQLAAEKAERDRINAERKAQREAQREQQNKEREERNARRAQDNGERRESRPDRRRRNSEDGEYELPPVTQTTTSLASLFANFKADEE